jgi:carboxyl-terminal processing protease
MSATDPADPTAASSAVPPPVGHATGEASEQVITDRQRAGWGTASDSAHDRRAMDDRRQGDRRAARRRADDRYALMPDPARDSSAGLALPSSEPPSLRVPPAGIAAGPADSAISAGRLLAVLLVIIAAFAGGIAVDQAAWRSSSPGAGVMVPAAPTAIARPAATPAPASQAPASGSPGASTPADSGQPPATPRVTPGPTIGPGATVPPDAPANVGLVWDALKTIEEHWVRRSQLNPTDLTYGLINGLVDALGDPGHTVFLTPAQVRSSNQSLSGQVTGIGVYLGVQGGAPFIQSVVSGSPASRAGVLPGDRIIAIDGTSAENLSVEEIGRLIRGTAGTPVALTILHPGADSPVVITIVRANITVPAVTWAMVPGTAIGDIRIAEFSSGSTDQLITALRGTRQAGAHGIVLDLRNNPGGYVDDAVGVASQFLSSGTIYIRRTADGNQIPVAVKPGGLGGQVPLVVLVDYGSASAAEIAAGALHDNHRATLVGTRTYGTGTVLNTFGLPDGSAIRLGVEEWLTPTGRAIFPNGIQPDEEVDLADNTPALEPDTIRAMTTAAIQASGDSQLLRALQLLAGR